MPAPPPSRPDALPPAERTIGQLVAESIRFYQEHFWQVLPLGLALAVIDQVQAGRTSFQQAVVLVAGAPLTTAAYVRASSLVSGRGWSWTAFAVGVLVYIPFPVLDRAYILPGLAWLALIGLAVPAAVVEGIGFRESLVRGRRLGLADYVHSLGAIVTLVLVYGLTSGVLLVVLHGQADAALRVALFLTDLALSPILFVGSALLYFDQEARLRSGKRPRRRDADLRAAHDPDQ
jgi:hypothetical protein